MIYLIICGTVLVLSRTRSELLKLSSLDSRSPTMSLSKKSPVTERALKVLEAVAGVDEPLTLNELAAATGLPKPTTHRLATLLEELGFAQRTMDGRRYAIGYRLAALGLEAARHSTQWGPRRALLTQLVADIGETCNITVLDGAELIYLDRVESSWPLQFRLSVGSRVPLHCTASGKLFLALAPQAFRAMLFQAKPLKAFTSKTITDRKKLEADLAKIRATGIGTDNEEFIEGMAAAAVPILDNSGSICATIAVHGPVARLPLERAIALTPALKRAAEAISMSYSPPRDSQ